MRVNGQHLAWGTGFVAQSRNGPVLLTNRHNVIGRNNFTGECISRFGALPDEIVVQHHQKGAAMGAWVLIAESLMDDAGQPRWIEHPRLREKADFVALPLTSTVAAEVCAVDLTEAKPAIQ